MKKYLFLAIVVLSINSVQSQDYKANIKEKVVTFLNSELRNSNMFGDLIITNIKEESEYIIIEGNVIYPINQNFHDNNPKNLRPSNFKAKAKKMNANLNIENLCIESFGGYDCFKGYDFLLCKYNK